MTHDELLDKIYWHWKNADDAEFFGLSGYRKALRAVVELHKPYTEREDGLIICNLACNDEGGYFEIYPCATIQAILKELA
jgi:hypothetical protein